MVSQSLTGSTSSQKVEKLGGNENTPLAEPTSLNRGLKPHNDMDKNHQAPDHAPAEGKPEAEPQAK